MSMRINAPAGTKVIYTGRGGYDNDKLHANRYLVAGKTYTVQATEIQSWSTRVFLAECHGVPFNSVMFNEVTDGAK